MTAETTQTANAPAETTEQSLLTTPPATPPAGGSPPATPPAGGSPPAKAGDAPAKEETATTNEDYSLTGDYDGEVLSAVAQTAKELGIAKDATQKILDAAAGTLAQRIEAKRAEVNEENRTAIINHAEFGKDKLQASLSGIAKVLDKFGSAELREWLNESGAGNNPHLFALLAKVGRAFSPDTFETGRPPVADQSPAKVIYPSMN